MQLYFIQADLYHCAIYKRRFIFWGELIALATLDLNGNLSINYYDEKNQQLVDKHTSEIYKFITQNLNS